MKLQLFHQTALQNAPRFLVAHSPIFFKHALKVRSNMFPINHKGEQIGVVEAWTRKNSNKRFVITADKETGVAVNIMRCNDAYIKSNYKK